MTLANPRKALTSYFETDPSKIADTTTLPGALSGLVRAGAGAVGNAGVGLYRAAARAITPTTTYAERNAAFAAPYQAPQPVRPALNMLPSHTRGASLAERFKTQPAPIQSAAPAGRGLVRRVAAPVTAPQGREIPLPEPSVTWDEQQAEAAPQERGYIEQDGTRYYVPGSKAYSGVSTIEPAFDQPAPQARLQAGDEGYTGSQTEWEDNQAADRMLSRPFPFKTQAALLAQRTQSEVEKQNRLNFGLNAVKTGAEVQHLGTEDYATRTLLPVKVAEGAANVEGTLAGAGLRRAETGKTILESREIPANAASLRGYQDRLGRSAEAGAAATLLKAPLEADLLKAQAKGVPDKMQIAAAADATRRDAQLNQWEKNRAADDPDFKTKYGIVGSDPEKFTAAEFIAGNKGLVFKAARKGGFWGKSKPAGWYTADGVNVPMAAMVDEYLKTEKKGGK